MSDFPKTINTKRLILRNLRTDDALPLFNLINSERDFIGRHLDWVGNIKSVADEEKYTAGRIAAAKNKTGFDWIIETKNGDFIGYVGTDPVTADLARRRKDIDYENKIVSFAYFINPKYTGNGYMTEALSELLRLSHDLGFARAEIHSDPKNERSIAVGRRCGMMPDFTNPGNLFLNF